MNWVVHTVHTGGSSTYIGQRHLQLQLSNSLSNAHAGSKAKGQRSKLGHAFLVTQPSVRVILFWLLKMLLHPTHCIEWHQHSTLWEGQRHLVYVVAARSLKCTLQHILPQYQYGIMGTHTLHTGIMHIIFTMCFRLTPWGTSYPERTRSCFSTRALKGAAG